MLHLTSLLCLINCLRHLLLATGKSGNREPKQPAKATQQDDAGKVKYLYMYHVFLSNVASRFTLRQRYKIISRESKFCIKENIF